MAPDRIPPARTAPTPRARAHRVRIPRPRASARALAPLPGPTAAAAPGRRWLQALALVVVTLLGAWLGLLVVGTVKVPVGPMDTRMALTPSASGGTRVDVSPLGALSLDSHRAPVRLDVDVDRLDPVRAQALVAHPERLSGLQDEVARDVRHGAVELGVRSCVAVVTGAAALGLLVYRRPRPALLASGLALALLAASGGTAWATWNPKSVLEPRFSGLLSSAPAVVGDARSIVTEFDVYSRELARLVTNVTKLYDVTSTLPVYQPDPSTVRVLHVSDIYLNPAAWPIVASLVEQYDIDVIIDSGDTMDHGSAAENAFLDPVADLGAPYVWVRGNHDSATTQKYLGDTKRFKNVRVLDEGRVVTVAGLRVAGTGDPQYTPDRTAERGGRAAEKAAGIKLAYEIRQTDEPVDIAVAHDPNAARETDGAVPLALAGHLHHREQEILPGGTRLRIEGSTGGSGLRAVEGEHPDPVQTSVLYLDKDTHRLQAWDEITLGGLGLSSAEVSRHIAGENQPGASPGPTGSGAAGPPAHR
ncbi:integral membrane protein [Streptomyces sp. SPB78]|uniref:metallophosphoesterase family protein n=1 Tax=Streptomyces sp. (strain SPB78) TaxID=591157 RepID=UPI0001B55421|nr:metallophosphoesterase [Streptomyces sp. SPB78]EFL01436.1 integral membrane protein [Streptomyces sp. SPB78]